MALWTDIIDPATLTGYVREDLEQYEVNKGTLARYLPNVDVADTVVRFWVGAKGLIPEARYRAFDAEPEMSTTQGGKRVILELPPISQNIPVSEYNQLRGRASSEDELRNFIQKAAVQAARAIADRTERMRGYVLVNGKAVIDQSNFKDTTDFERDADMTITATAAQKWDGQPDVDRIAYLEDLVDQYNTKNHALPGRMVMSRRILRALMSGSQFRTQLNNGASRPALRSDVEAMLSSAGLPDIEVFDRATSGGLVIPNDVILFLPEPGPTTATEGGPLGATYYGQTLTSTDPNYGIEAVDQPGVVVGTYRGEKPPMIAETISDAIVMPVLGDANWSMAVSGLV